MKFLAKNFLFVILFFVILAIGFSFVFQSLEEQEEISFSQLLTHVQEERVERIVVQGESIEVFYADGTQATSVKESGTALSESLLQHGIGQEVISSIDIEFQEEQEMGFVWLLALFVLPVAIFLVFFWFIFRQAKTGANQAFDFTKSRARLFGSGTGQKKQEKTTFEDVAGLEEAKEELQEVVEFLKNPKKFHQIGARIPHGVLLLGPPGCGKTLLARAAAGESNVPFFHTSASSFIELFVGVGASRVRDLFATAKKSGKAIIFIDELDAIGRARGAGIGGGHDEREQTLNQILVEMDGFEKNAEQIVIAATNRPDILDPALMRPGRFDRRVTLDLPDMNDRESILRIHARGKPIDQEVKMREIAERTPGFSGADLANLVNEAAILTARRNKTQVGQNELLESIDKVMLGPERKSHILSTKEKEIAAFHEAGHALVSSTLLRSEPVRKLSIVSRGFAAGYMLKLPSQEKKFKTRKDFEAELAILLGGYCAEELIFKNITTGASNDLEKASQLTRKLIKEYGMSSFGPVFLGKRDELVFLGREISEERNYSEQVASRIDKEMIETIRQAKSASMNVLKTHKKTLERIARRLIEKETIEKEEFEQLMKTDTVNKKRSPRKKHSVRTTTSSVE